MHCKCTIEGIEYWIFVSSKWFDLQNWCLLCCLASYPKVTILKDLSQAYFNKKFKTENIEINNF